MSNLKKKRIKIMSFLLSMSMVQMPLMQNTLPSAAVYAEEKAPIKNGGTAQLSVGDTVTLECESSYSYYGYNDDAITWSAKPEGVVSIESSENEYGYSKRTKATVKAIKDGTAVITFKAVKTDVYGNENGTKTETFTVKVGSGVNDQTDPEPAEALKIDLAGVTASGDGNALSPFLSEMKKMMSSE